MSYMTWCNWSESICFYTSLRGTLLSTKIHFTYSQMGRSLQTVGVIFKTERDSFRVLDQNGQVRLVQPHQISMRKDSNNAIATDAEGHELKVNDNVKEVDGEVRPCL